LSMFAPLPIKTLAMQHSDTAAYGAPSVRWTICRSFSEGDINLGAGESRILFNGEQ